RPCCLNRELLLAAGAEWILSVTLVRPLTLVRAFASLPAAGPHAGESAVVTTAAGGGEARAGAGETARPSGSRGSGAADFFLGGDGLGLLRTQHVIAEPLLRRDDAVAVQVHLLELLDVAAVGSPLVEPDLAILIRI